MQSMTVDLMGKVHDTEFPLLFKFIDANDKLSVQVHADDQQSRTHHYGQFGKTECWYIAHAKPGATIICGVRPHVTAADIRASISDNSLEKLLNVLPVKTGDMFFVPAGTVHAICEGTLIYEVQQSSDTTFRLYDWGRVDDKGKPRQLHVEESLSVVDTTAHNRHCIEPVERTVALGVIHRFRVACRYFAVEEYVLAQKSSVKLPAKTSFQVLTVLQGSIIIKTVDDETTVSSGRTVLLPASIGQIAIACDQQSCMLVSTVPDLQVEIVDVLRTSGIEDDLIESLGGNPKRNDLIQYLI